MSNFYYLSNDLDTLENKMQNFVSVLETIASSDSDDLSSGTMWFIHDTIKQYAYEVCVISMRAMDHHRELQELETKKGKKKNAG
jgi:hypothetical protein